MNDTVQQEEESMEDILSSIRSTVEEEVSKNGEDAQPEAAAPQENEEGADAMASEEVDEILDLTDIVEEVESEISADAADTTDAAPQAAEVEEHNVESDLVDINKFSETGEVAPADEAEVAAARETYTEDGEEVPVDETAAKEDAVEEVTEEVSAEPADAEAAAEAAAEEILAGAGAEEETAEPAAEEAVAEVAAEGAEDDDDVDIDDLMAEMASDGQLPTAENMEMPSEEDAAETIAQLADEEAPAEEAVEETPVAEAIEEVAAAEEVTEEVAEETPAEVETPDAADVAAAAVTEQVVEEAARKVRLSTTPSAQGLQVTFPVEVLAEALRPLVKDWVNENLPDIVQRLVREEFSRLADK